MYTMGLFGNIFITKYPHYVFTIIKTNLNYNKLWKKFTMDVKM